MLPFRPALRPGALAAGLVLLLGTPAVAQSDILLQLESGNPAGERFVVDSAGGVVARGVIGRGTIPSTGPGTQLMWYPGRGAFRAGRVDGGQWAHANIGLYSVAIGFNAAASGESSTAMGFATTASGLVSTATGGGTMANGEHSTAMGYYTTASGDYSTALGGFTTTDGMYSIAMGGGTTASGHFSTAMGLSTTASGGASTALGNGTVASGLSSTAMGEDTRAGGDYSTAMGRYASTADYMGSFVYGDGSGSTTDIVHASAANQATWRTTGGFRIFTNTALSNGCLIAAGGTAWSCTSSRLEKENFAEVDGEDVLRRLRAVPVTSWNGIAEGAQVRHIGPMAQDWHAAFGLNDDPLTIHQGDLAGVSLAAVQALDGRTRGVPEMEERIRQLEVENAAVIREAASLRREAAEQRARLERLEARLAAEP
jgi:trimeric autotransporter adhesin